MQSGCAAPLPRVAASGETNVQELLAAALSDYRTLVQVLYDAGHFSPVVNIRLDGQEAAQIPAAEPAEKRPQGGDHRKTRPAVRLWQGRAGAVSAKQRCGDSRRLCHRANRLATGVIRDAAIAGVRAWRRSGHAKAEVVDQNITANHLQARLDAELRLAPGPKLRFGQMRITGDTKVRKGAIRRIAGFPEGEEFPPRPGFQIRPPGCGAPAPFPLW